MGKNIGGLLVLAIAAVAAFNVNMNTEKNELSLLALANVEALANNESGGTSTWQVGSKEIVSTTSPGWTFDIKGGFWLFEGKKTVSSPPSTSKVTIKCCRAQGDQAACPYEDC